MKTAGHATINNRYEYMIIIRRDLQGINTIGHVLGQYDRQSTVLFIAR